MFSRPTLPTSLPLPVTLDEAAAAQWQGRLDGLAKPPGALGRMEALAVRLALIAGRVPPPMRRVPLLVFAGDHGLVAEGVSAYPAHVTPAMVRTILDGRATASAFAGAVGSDVRVVDAGVAVDLAPHPHLLGSKIGRGARNAAREPAMTAGEVDRSLLLGAAVARDAITEGADALALGEMGIGNSAVAALLMHRLLPAPVEDCVGLGTGHDPAGLARKRDAVSRASARVATTEPLAVLAEFGGFEIVAMAGAILAAAASRRPVVVDGFIVTVAALVAARLCPAATGYCIFAHRSAERGHARLLAELGAEPLLDLGLKLGEGTGALLAVPLLRAAAALFSEVATLDEVLAGAA